MLLHARVDVGEGADRAGDGAGGDLLARRDEPRAAARELGIGLRQLEAEGGRLGMDAVGAADGGRHLVLEGAALQRGEQRVDVGEQEVGGARELHGEAGVEHVRRGHALVDEARVRADELGEMREEGDDVVLHLALDLVDALDVERRRAALLPDRLRPLPSGSRRVRPARRRHAPRSRTRCGTWSPATRSRPSRGGNSGGSCDASLVVMRYAQRGSLLGGCDLRTRRSRPLPDGGDVGRVGVGVPPLNTAEPATSTLAPASATSGAVSGVTPPSTSMSMARPPIMRLHAAQLVDDPGNEGLAAEAGIDGHQQDQVDASSTCSMRAVRGAGIERRRRPSCRAPDRLQRAVQMRAGFGMNGDDVGAGLGEGLEIGIDRRDHQMHVEGLGRVRPQRLHHVRAEGDVRHEMAVHHVEVDPVARRRRRRRGLPRRAGRSRRRGWRGR